MPLLKFENMYIKSVESHKHLGLTLSYNGQWTDHINNVKKKKKKSAAKVLGIMRKLKFSFSRSALNQIYLTYEAARIVTGLTRSVSLDRL